MHEYAYSLSEEAGEAVRDGEMRRKSKITSKGMAGIKVRISG